MDQTTAAPFQKVEAVVPSSFTESRKDHKTMNTCSPAV